VLFFIYFLGFIDTLLFLHEHDHLERRQPLEVQVDVQYHKVHYQKVKYANDNHGNPHCDHPREIPSEISLSCHYCSCCDETGHLQKHRYYHPEKRPIVSFSYTVVYPDAVMIEGIDTTIAHTTMLRVFTTIAVAASAVQIIAAVKNLPVS
jgi:hypothetical protein